MKRTLSITLGVFLISMIFLSGCTKNVPVKEELTNYGDNSTVYMPVVEAANPGVTQLINTEIRFKLEENFKKVKGDTVGTTTEGFTAFQNGDLLSIFQEGYFEKAGTSENGDSYLVTFHVNIKNGNFYVLDDLFNAGYEKELETTITNILDTQLGEYYMTYKPDLKNTSFDVFGNEIIFIFDPQTVAPKHMGFIDAAISFNQIDHLLNKEGEFYQVLTAEAN